MLRHQLGERHGIGVRAVHFLGEGMSVHERLSPAPVERRKTVERASRALSMAGDEQLATARRRRRHHRVARAGESIILPRVRRPPPRFDTGDQVLAAVLGVVVLAQAVVVLTGPGDPFIDDSYISLRYARNLVEGHGLVFNPGERVEGYTHPLWVLLDALLLSLRLPPRAALAAIGTACWIGAAVTTLRACRESGASRVAGALAAGTVAAAATGVFWGLSGLETTAFAWAAIEAMRRWLAAAQGRTSGVGAGVAFGIACWLRPEGALLLGAAVAVSLALAVRSHNARSVVAAGARAALGLALTVAPWVVFRLAYYEAWLPNTFHAKTIGNSAWMLERGLRYLGGCALQGPLVALAIALVAAPRALRRVEVAAPAAAAVALVAWVVRVGGDYLPFGRFLVPALPFLALALAGCMDELRERAYPTAARALGAVACAAGLLGHFGAERVRAFENATARFLVAGAWLREHVPQEALVSTPAAGAVGWVGRTRVLDEFGLTDAYLATHLDPRLDASKLRAPAGHSRGNAEYALERAPDLMLFANVWVRPIPMTPKALQENLAITSITDRLLLSDDRFLARYEIVNVRIDELTWLGVAVRRDSAVRVHVPALR